MQQRGHLQFVGEGTGLFVLPCLEYLPGVHTAEAVDYAVEVIVVSFEALRKAVPGKRAQGSLEKVRAGYVFRLIAPQDTHGKNAGGVDKLLRQIGAEIPDHLFVLCFFPAFDVFMRGVNNITEYFTKVVHLKVLYSVRYGT